MVHYRLLVEVSNLGVCTLLLPYDYDNGHFNGDGNAADVVFKCIVTVFFLFWNN